ncbi:MAG: Nif3-like dinuclear metal center hexameric protein [Desulforhopalus sp.]|nr:Nif3-like dinuclear metal center hexameric protein [Desulforhopalus sp.]
MTVRVQDILKSLNILAPFNLAEPWDNVGLLVGNPNQEVTAILAGLDPTSALIDEAIAQGANTVITHHPVIFKPLQAINTTTLEGRLLEKALSNRIAIIGCHTNYDSAPAGVSAILAEQLGLVSLRPLLPTSPEKLPDIGLGRIGDYPAAISSNDFMQRVLRVLQLESVQMAGPLPEKIRTVAICGGSGSDLAPQALALGAQVYLSAEIKHNIAVWANECRFCIIDGSHYATEKPAVRILVKQLEQICQKENWNIRIMETTTECHPFVTKNRSHQ